MGKTAMTLKVKGLLNRNGWWYYRRVVMPRSLAQVIGKTELVVSLQTRDLAAAVERLKVEKKKADGLLADAKRAASSPEAAAEAWKRKTLAGDLRERLGHTFAVQRERYRLAGFHPRGFIEDRGVAPPTRIE